MKHKYLKKIRGSDFNTNKMGLQVKYNVFSYTWSDKKG